MSNLIALAKQMQPILAEPMIDELMRGDVRDVLKHALLALLPIIQSSRLVRPVAADIFKAFSPYTTLADVRVVLLTGPPSADTSSLAGSCAGPFVRAIVDAVVYQRKSKTGPYDLSYWGPRGIMCLATPLTADDTQDQHVFWDAYVRAIIAKLAHAVVVIWADTPALTQHIVDTNCAKTFTHTPHPTIHTNGKEVVNPDFVNTPVFGDIAEYFGQENMWELSADTQPDSLICSAIGIPVDIQPGEVAPAPVVNLQREITPEPTENRQRVVMVEPVVNLHSEITPESTENLQCEITPESIENMQSVVIDCAAHTECLDISTPAIDYNVDKMTPPTGPYNGNLLVYIPKAQAGECRVFYKIQMSTVVFVTAKTYTLADHADLAIVAAHISGDICKYTQLTVCDIVDLLVDPNTTIVGNFPHSLCGGCLRVRVYGKIAGLATALKYPYKRTNWSDARSREKHDLLYA